MIAKLNVLWVVLLVTACGTNGALVSGSADEGIGSDVEQQVVTADAGVPDPAMLPSVHWVRNSAEYQAAVRQTYKFATMVLEEKAYSRTSSKPWGVIVDADDTIISNSQYQKERGTLGFSPDSWNEWTQRKAATAMPGAAAFLGHVKEMGGFIIVVTNREATQCDNTRANLTAVKIPFTEVLCKTDSSDKNIRFAAVQAGTATASLPAMDVLMYVGDNIQDFPKLTQDLRTGSAIQYVRFGDQYFVLPNPMYGSWEKNAKL